MDQDLKDKYGKIIKKKVASIPDYPTAQHSNEEILRAGIELGQILRDVCNEYVTEIRDQRIGLDPNKGIIKLYEMVLDEGTNRLG